MKKICFIASVYSPYTKGGAETVVNNIVRGFCYANYQVVAITIRPFKNLTSLWPKKSLENGVTVYRFYPLNLFSFININHYNNRPWWRFFWHIFDVFNFHAYLIVRLILKREQPIVVMTHALKGISYLVPWAIKTAGIKHIHTLHDVQLSTPSGLILKGEEKSWQHTFFLTKLYQFFNRRLFNSPEIVISSSKFLLEFYLQRGFFPSSKKVILTNPINIEAEKSPPFQGGAAERSEAGVVNSIFSFLFLGQIETYKGILLLIKVFKKLLATTNNNKNINLLIVGDGSALEEAKRVAGVEMLHATSLQNQIKFFGYVPNEELNKIFVQTDVTVVPSLCYENSPTVIFESLAHGVPVLAARIGGIEFVRDNYNGFTFEAGDENDLLRLMKFVLQNKKQLTEMSANCQESVKEIGTEKYIEKLEKLI